MLAERTWERKGEGMSSKTIVAAYIRVYVRGWLWSQDKDLFFLLWFWSLALLARIDIQSCSVFLCTIYLTLSEG